MILRKIALFAASMALAGLPTTARAVTDVELNSNLCDKDWNGAMNILGAMIASPETAPEQRALLARQRRQIQDHTLYGMALPFEVDCAEVGTESEVTIAQAEALSQGIGEDSDSSEVLFDWQAEAQAIQSGKRKVWSNTSVASAPSVSAAPNRPTLVETPAAPVDKEDIVVIGTYAGPGEFLVSLGNNGEQPIHTYHIRFKLGRSKTFIKEVRSKPLIPGHYKNFRVRFEDEDGEFFSDVEWTVLRAV